MKPRVWVTAGGLLAGCCALFALAALDRQPAPASDPASLLPQGALVAIEAGDFRALLHDWNSSEEKQAWIRGANYESFSRSRLFERLSQAQDEFSAAASIAPDLAFLQSVAGKQSCLGVYDIGKLEFVYITRMDTAAIENSPLWMLRDKFERRSEAGSDFYVRKDSSSSRTAAFAARDGWLILATREDLVADALDQMAGNGKENLASEAWYAEAVKQAGSPGELRMVLNLTKIVPSPYFRSYWVQRNITEMKQYSSVVSDLKREGAVYREERVLLRRDSNTAAPQGDVRSIASLAPDGVALSLAQVAPDSEGILQALRENLLERRPQAGAVTQTTAPAAASENAGDASQLDTPIDQAPAVAAQADPFQSLRALLAASPPVAMMQCYTSGSASNDVFVSLGAAAVLEAQSAWDSQAVQNALTAALAPKLTAGALGARWTRRTGASGDYLALDGAVDLFLKVDGKWLLLSSDPRLLDGMLARLHNAAPSAGADAATYMAAYYPARERSRYQQLMHQLDHAASGGENGNSGSPTFFAGNIGSLSQAFSSLDSEQMDERDGGSLVRQTVTYRWKQ